MVYMRPHLPLLAATLPLADFSRLVADADTSLAAAHKAAQRQQTQPSARELLVREGGSMLRPFKGAFRKSERGRTSRYPKGTRGAPKYIRAML